MTLKSFARKVLKIIRGNEEKRILHSYFRDYSRFSFSKKNCKHFEQYEGSITRLYHTVEKGLSYDNYRAGFGIDDINTLLDYMSRYSTDEFNTSEAFYQTAVDVLYKYVAKNKTHGLVDAALERRIKQLDGTGNGFGGTVTCQRPSFDWVQSADYRSFVENRRSIRHFSKEEVSIEKIKEALNIAQHTPSACNRQGWKAYVLENKELILETLKYQNGNRGFGEEIDKLIVITGDLRYFNRDRETFQVYIDGGMYAMRVIDSLHYMGLGTIPLSASVYIRQRDMIKKLVGIHDAEVLIMLIGIGNYPDIYTTARSQRREPKIKVL